MRVCIFAAGCDRAAVQQVLATLPADAYGHVFITEDSATAEGPGTALADPAGPCPALCAPDRVQVSQLLSRDGGCPLAAAMTGWAAEWLPAGEGPVADTPTVWVLPGATTRLAGAGHECVTRLVTALPGDQLIHG